MNKIVTDIASKVLVTLAAGAGAILAKAATEKGIGSVVKKIADSKEAVKEVAENAAEAVASGEATETLTSAMETVTEAAAEVAEEASGA